MAKVTISGREHDTSKLPVWAQIYLGSKQAENDRLRAELERLSKAHATCPCRPRMVKQANRSIASQSPESTGRTS